MSEHTSGPWIIQSDPCHYDTLSTVVAGERMIVHVGGCCEPAEQEANARLIAAAPDLLESLKTLVTNVSRQGWNDSYAYDMDKARAALAKAEGEV